jgi:hypothetical protein
MKAGGVFSFLRMTLSVQTEMLRSIEIYQSKTRNETADSGTGLCWPVSLRADFQAGMDAYNRKDFGTAYREFLPLAEQGDAKAQFSLGLMYYNGYGVPEDDAEAVQWFRLAAKQGLAEAQYKLGLMYYNGWGVPQDYAKAVRWYRLAAEQGDPNAQYKLELMYESGKGAPKD